METPAAHCKEESELLKLLKEVHEILSKALNSLNGTTPPTHESSYLCSAADSVCLAADGYIFLRENGRVNASKLLIRPMVEAALFASAVVNVKGFYFRKRYSEFVDEGKLRGNAPQMKAQVKKASSDLAAILQKGDPTYPIKEGAVSVFDAAHAVGMRDVYEIVYRMYCQYTHGSAKAARGEFDGVPNGGESTFHDGDLKLTVALNTIEALTGASPGPFFTSVAYRKMKVKYSAKLTSKEEELLQFEDDRTDESLDGLAERIGSDVGNRVAKRYHR